MTERLIQFGRQPVWRIVKVKAPCDSSNLCYVVAEKFIVINPDHSNGENIRQWMEADKNNKSVKKYFFLRPIAWRILAIMLSKIIGKWIMVLILMRRKNAAPPIPWRYGECILCFDKHYIGRVGHILFVTLTFLILLFRFLKLDKVFIRLMIDTGSCPSISNLSIPKNLKILWPTLNIAGSK